MTDECFFYFFPGYLLGVVNHERLFLDRVADSLLDVLSPHERSETGMVLFLYLSAMLTPSQKKAVAHWLQLELERDQECSPELYYSEAAKTQYQVAFDKWRQWT